MGLQLEGQEWLLGEPLGEGGFGQVYSARSAAGEWAAVKLVPKERGAERELLFEDLAGARNVVPIIDRGETEDSWVLVMPRAEKSLRQQLKMAAGPLKTADAVAILSDIAAALVDLDGRVVHRDLKPENVLLLNGRWCLADFGIARYAQATTAPDTRKLAWTKPYAAPEQWREERATSATDVYAFGVIAYELLKGCWPFAGPDFREQHLHNPPPSLPDIPVTLDALVQECLYKAPAARPSPANLLARLGRIAESHPSSRGLADLQNANRGEVSRRGDVDRRESASQSEAERRDNLFQAAIQGLSGISDALREAIIENASTATVEQVPGGWTIRLNSAELRFTPPTKTQPVAGPWGPWRGPIDVIAHASLILTRAPDLFDDPLHYYKGRSHSLWYCNAKEEGRYQCFETAFMVSRAGADPSLHNRWASEMDRRFNEVPFSLDPGQESIQALSADPSIFEVAWPFTVVSIGELDEFIDRWASWLANASEGRLDRPLKLPERPTQGSWRQS